MSEEKNEIELNERHKRFCESYFKDFNGSRAYREVYGEMGEEVARAAASRLLSNVNVKSYLESLKTRLAELSGISPLMILNEHRKIAFSSIANLHLTWITRKEFEDLSDDDKGCIQEIDTKIKTEYQFNPETEKKEPISVEYVRIRLFDKAKSLESINKMLGYDLPTKIDLSNEDGSFKSLPTVIYQVPENIIEKLNKKGQ